MLQEKELDKEYAGIMGYESFRKAAAKLAFGPQSGFMEDGLVWQYYSTYFTYGKLLTSIPQLRPYLGLEHSDLQLTTW